jgi:hypothetical protein
MKKSKKKNFNNGEITNIESKIEVTEEDTNLI